MKNHKQELATTKIELNEALKQQRIHEEQAEKWKGIATDLRTKILFIEQNIR